MPSDLGDHARARLGTVIHSKYRLERLIGSGGMASVYAAVHQNNGNRVAIKVLHPHLSIDAELRARFLREGYVANKVEHGGAVRVLDDDTTDDGAVFLVMELLEGETLDARFQRCGHKLPVREVCELAFELLDVLAAAHAKGIVHRDIKPENLFLTGEGVLKVLDFGIARLREAGGTQAATQTGRTIGTPAFMPPEQALGRSKQIDGQTDLWAVGATMLTLVSGQYVHDAETMQEMLVRAGSQPARPVAAVSPGLPPAIAAVIGRAPAFAREERWANARAMEAALENAYRTAFGVTMPGARRTVQSRFLEPTEPGPAVHHPSLGASELALPSSLDRKNKPVASESIAPLGQTASSVRAGRPSVARFVFVAGALASFGGVGVYGVLRRSPAIGDVPAVKAAAASVSSATIWGTANALIPAVLPSAGMIFAAPHASAVSPTDLPIATARAPASPTRGAIASGVHPAQSPALSATATAASSPMTNAARASAPGSRDSLDELIRMVASQNPVASTSARAAPPLVSSAVNANNSRCNPPYFIDADGIKIFRPECL